MRGSGGFVEGGARRMDGWSTYSKTRNGSKDFQD